jgi:hypothetical protein
MHLLSATSFAMKRSDVSCTCRRTSEVKYNRVPDSEKWSRSSSRGSPQEEVEDTAKDERRKEMKSVDVDDLKLCVLLPSTRVICITMQSFR